MTDPNLAQQSPPLADPRPTATQLLTRTEASAALQLFGIRMKPATLARVWSTGGSGPPCQHIRNKPYYPRDRLEAWARSQITEPASSARERDLQRREAARHAPR